ncbi:hypothetical protein Lokhon_02485 [Limimaricola hongkongensis DSM 17492]|uniref:Uncharacterized protein n=1 Tax=Limimaricola hongkongensis DSM 17492 TaxID=1122180 RepID=A0A017H8L3_9RHOB|nr:hypothetical protein Lokhon_02485 [Limimaricola hongkongensis DSM 17492]
MVVLRFGHTTACPPGRSPASARNFDCARRHPARRSGQSRTAKAGSRLVCT